jgi:hypothetical protein
MPTQVDFNLQGLHARPAQCHDLVVLLQPGDEVFLERDKHNSFDPDGAIKVYLDTPGTGRLWIGWVEALVNKKIAGPMDMGFPVKAEVIKTYEYDGSKPGKGSMWSKPMIRVVILD